MAGSLRPGHRPPDDRLELTCGVHQPDGTVVTAGPGCGQTDDHPKHIIAEADGSTTVRHLDCCNCMPCVVQLDHAKGAHGLDLADHLQEHGDTLAKKIEKLAESEG